jgi:hypothetical protein
MNAHEDGEAEKYSVCPNIRQKKKKCGGSPYNYV